MRTCCTRRLGDSSSSCSDEGLAEGDSPHAVTAEALDSSCRPFLAVVSFFSDATRMSRPRFVNAPTGKVPIGPVEPRFPYRGTQKSLQGTRLVPTGDVAPPYRGRSPSLQGTKHQAYSTILVRPLKLSAKRNLLPFRLSGKNPVCYTTDTLVGMVVPTSGRSCTPAGPFSHFTHDVDHVDVCRANNKDEAFQKLHTVRIRPIKLWCEDAAVPPEPSRTGADPAARLRQLDALKAEGLITEAEYAEKRSKIIAEL